MDLGLTGRHAIICASSQGLGLACAQALAAEGVHVVLNGRDPQRLAAVADGLRRQATGTVVSIVADLSTGQGRADLLAACPAPDILVTNNAGPPPRALADLDEAALQAALTANMLIPAALVRAVLPGMRRRGFGRVVNISSVAARMPVPGLEASTAARAGLSGFMAGAARQVAPFGVTINNLLPGYFATGRMVDVIRAAAARDGQAVETAEQQWRGQIPAGRLGEPPEFGAVCAFLCSRNAAYVTGQNILVDGGLYPGVF